MSYGARRLLPIAFDADFKLKRRRIMALKNEMGAEYDARLNVASTPFHCQETALCMRHKLRYGFAGVGSSSPTARLQ